MSTGFRNSAGVDFDSLFDPFVSGTPPAATGLRLSTGVDLAGRYAPISVGSKGPDVGFRTSGGVDVSNLWAAFGTASYSLPINGQTFQGYSSGAVSSSMLASASVAIKADGTYSVICVGNATVTSPANGTWLPSGGAVANYQVQYGVTQTHQSTNGPATITNDAASYAACTTNRTCQASATTGQHGGLEIGGDYTVVIRLKNVSTGAVNTTTIYFSVQSVGAA